MIYSMTGYGRKEISEGDKTIIVELRSLNGKQLDINCKLSTVLRPYEHEIRKLAQSYLHRGSVDMSVFINQNGASKPMQINIELAKSYYQSIKQLTTELGISDDQSLQSILSFPDIVVPINAVLDDQEYQTVSKVIKEVLMEVQAFRQKEGLMLEQVLTQCVKNIKSLLNTIDQPENERIPKIKEKISNTLKELIDEEKIDQNRLEQEMIYYVEKLDVSEEKARLANHCDLFLDTIASNNETGIGRKLTFILQEIGREINTLGSKSNNATMQAIVVNMKDELEQAKEQTFNVL